MQANKLEPVMKACNREVRRDYGPMSQRSDLGPEVGVVVCTFEKANTRINRLIDQQQLGCISCVVVDELHMVRNCRLSPKADTDTTLLLPSRTVSICPI